MLNVATIDKLEGEVLRVGNDLSVGELATDEALRVERGDQVLRSITEEILVVGDPGEGDIGWSCAIDLVMESWRRGARPVTVRRRQTATAREGERRRRRPSRRVLGDDNHCGPCVRASSHSLPFTTSACSQVWRRFIFSLFLCSIRGFPRLQSN